MQEKRPLEYKFDEFTLDVKGHQLWHQDEQIKLTPKAYKTLYALVRRGGEMVSKDELLDEVWEDAFVEEGSLTQNISVLRKVFAPKNYIKTYPRLGYKFTVVAKEIYETETIENKVDSIDYKSQETNSNLQTPQVITQKPRIRWHLIAIVFLGIFLVSSFTFWVNFRNADLTSNDKPKLGFIDENQIKSIAVLPFKDLDGTEQNKTFSLGLVDNLINRLGGLNRFVIRPLSSVQEFSESGQSATIFGKKLRVDAVLVGTLQKDNKRLRVSVQLLNVQNGQQIWSSKFDKNETDVFKLQDDLSNQVATILINKISEDETDNLNKRDTDVFDAYQAYSKGLYYQNKRTSEDIIKAIKHFERAIKLDENYAKAYVGLADCYLLLSDSDYGEVNPLEVKEKVNKLLNKALLINPNSAEALTSFGMYEMNINWDLRSAENNYKKAISLNPKLSKAHHWYAWNLIAQKRFDEADTQMQLARELNPTSKIIVSEMGIPMVFKGDFEKAIKYCKEAVEMNKNYVESHFQLWYAYHYSAKYEDAFKELETIKRLTAGEDDEYERIYLIISGLTLAATGQYTEAQENYRKVVDMVKEGEYVSPIYLALFAFAVDEKDETFKWLEMGKEERNDYLLFLNISPEFKEIRTDPRFEEFTIELGLN